MNGPRIVNGVSITILGVFGAAAMFDLAGYWRAPSDYIFGTEVGGFIYTTPPVFVVANTITVGLAICGIAGPLMLQRAILAARIRVAAALLVMMPWVHSLVMG